jgi:hypothetical protein
MAAIDSEILTQLNVQANPQSTKQLATLWGGLGTIVLLKYPSPSPPIVLKRVNLPSCASSSLSVGDARKIQSYHVESSFYSTAFPSKLADQNCSTPRPVGTLTTSSHLYIAMSHIPGSSCYSSIDLAKYLARFHSVGFLHGADSLVQEHGLQPQGSFWYLDTRLSELAGVRSGKPNSKTLSTRVKAAATAIDFFLKSPSALQTILHGDAKSANMFENGDAVASCDFQYCGKGSCARDLAYALGCGGDGGFDVYDEFINAYCEELSHAGVPDVSSPAFKKSLHTAMQFACADLYRWMLGWGMWGDSDGFERVTSKLLDALDGGKQLASEKAYAVAVERLMIN